MISTLKQSKGQSQGGVTLLLTVLILSASLSIALGIFYIIFVQLQISRGAKESYRALYAADTGKECALFYRYRYNNTNPLNIDVNGGFWSSDNPCEGASTCKVRCAGSGDIDVSVTSPASGVYIYRYQINTNDICADVTVRMENKTFGVTQVLETLISSTGKNTCASVDPNFVVNRVIQYCDNADNGPCTPI